MPVDPKEFSRQLHDERLQRALPTTNDHLDRFPSAGRKASEQQARIDEHKRDQARDFLTRRNLGRVPGEDEIDAFIGLSDPDGAA